MIHAVESKPVVVKGVIQQVNECKGLWVLKNSLSRNPQKLDSVRMPYKRNYWLMPTPDRVSFLASPGIFGLIVSTALCGPMLFGTKITLTWQAAPGCTPLWQVFD